MGWEVKETASQRKRERTYTNKVPSPRVSWHGSIGLLSYWKMYCSILGDLTVDHLLNREKPHAPRRPVSAFTCASKSDYTSHSIGMNKLCNRTKHFAEDILWLESCYLFSTRWRFAAFYFCWISNLGVIYGVGANCACLPCRNVSGMTILRGFQGPATV